MCKLWREEKCILQKVHFYFSGVKRALFTRCSGVKSTTFYPAAQQGPARKYNIYMMYIAIYKVTCNHRPIIFRKYREKQQRRPERPSAKFEFDVLYWNISTMDIKTQYGWFRVIPYQVYSRKTPLSSKFSLMYKYPKIEHLAYRQRRNIIVCEKNYSCKISLSLDRHFAMFEISNIIGIYSDYIYTKF